MVIQNISFSVDGQKIKYSTFTRIVANSVNVVTATFSFTQEWENYIKKAIFSIGDISKTLILTENTVEIPSECLTLGTLYVSVVGVIDEPYSRITTEKMMGIPILRSGELNGDTVNVPTPTEGEQLLTIAQEALDTAVVAMSKGSIITIAPYNSTQKNNAKIVLNGSNDAVAINDCVESLTDGGLLHFLDGDIIMTGNDTIILRDKISIKGSGNSTRFRLSDNAIGFSQVSGNGTLLNVSLMDFQILGNRDTAPSTQTIGVKLSCQESTFTGLRVHGCMIGVNVDGGYPDAQSLMNYISMCSFLSNARYGVRLGTDSNVSQCLIGDNGNPETMSNVEYDACGILISGWGNNISNNHIYKNQYQIRAEWTVGNMITSNMFESGYREDILFAGRAHSNNVNGNSFGGKDRSAVGDYSVYNCITFDGSPSGEGSMRNTIVGNSLVYYAPELTEKTPYNYFVEECVNCDYNAIAFNTINEYYKKESVVILIGENSRYINNI